MIYINNINFLKSILHEFTLFRIIYYQDMMKNKVKKLHWKIESKWEEQIAVILS